MAMISFDNEMQALTVSETRAALIARNLANSNTPYFKAQDINFQEAMRQTSKLPGLNQTNVHHISQPAAAAPGIYYRVPMQHKLDENTVDNEIERKNFIENSLKYQASLGFIDRKAAQYIKAIRGE